MTVVSKYTQTSVDDSLADSGIVSLSRSPSISSVECNTYFVSRLSKVERNVPKCKYFKNIIRCGYGTCRRIENYN